MLNFLGYVFMQWTVVVIAIGGGADGEGISPSPVSNSRKTAHLIDPSSPGLRPQWKAVPFMPLIVAIWNKQMGFQQSLFSLIPAFLV
jgi:hypothetical protein